MILFLTSHGMDSALRISGWKSNTFRPLSPRGGAEMRDGDETGSTIIQSFFSTREASSNQPILEVSYTPYVGGDIIATNTISLLTPWILAAIILTGTVVALKRRQH